MAQVLFRFFFDFFSGQRHGGVYGLDRGDLRGGLGPGVRPGYMDYEGCQVSSVEGKRDR